MVVNFFEHAAGEGDHPPGAQRLRDAPGGPQMSRNSKQPSQPSLHFMGSKIGCYCLPVSDNYAIMLL